MRSRRLPARAVPPRPCLPALPHRSSGLRSNRLPGPVGAVPLRTAASTWARKATSMTSRRVTPTKQLGSGRRPRPNGRT
eukprot:12456865-Alexandrium_andersonii.AAC.1